MDMTIEPTDMLLFATVVSEGGFSAAAKRLGLSRQRVSEAVARLEGRLGVRLLERTTRRVAVTEAGASYAARCATIAAQIEEANAAARERQSAPVGRLRVSAPVLYGRRFLAPVVSGFVRRYPDVQVELTLQDRRVDLIEEGFDLAIRAGALDDSGLNARKLGAARVVVVASPSALAGRAPPTTAADVAAWPCITTRQGERWPFGGREVAIRSSLWVNDLEVARDAAIGGAGLVRLPRFLCAEALSDGRLVEVLTGEAPVVSGVYVVMPSRVFLPARVRLFVDALVAEGASLDDG